MESNKETIKPEPPKEYIRPETTVGGGKEKGMLTGMALREKYWSELDIVQKVERLRSFNKLQIDMLYREIKSLELEVEHLKNHSHNTGGDIVLPYKRIAYINMAMESDQTKDRNGFKEPDQVYI